MHLHETVIRAIESSPYNCGLEGKDWLASGWGIPVVFDGGDVALFEHEGDGIFEVHFLFKSRGRKAIDRVRKAFEMMFEMNGATTIYGLIPEANRKMKLVARWAGAKSRGIRWLPEGACELFTISRGGR